MSSSGDQHRSKRGDAAGRSPLTAGPDAAQEQLYRSAPWSLAGAVASGVAHEANNPLTAIIGFSSALLARMNSLEEIDKKELASYLQVIHGEAMRCHRIIDHFRRFSKLNKETGEGSAVLNECVAGALSLVAMSAARSEITLVNRLEGACRVQADGMRLEQIFVNLFLNRIGCCGPGTTVTIAVPGERDKSSRRMTTVIVSDNAVRPPPGDETDFYSTAAGGGKYDKPAFMGLGFCRRAVEDLGGTFSCDCAAEQGTTFRIGIPAGAGPESGENV